ncbi:MAG: NAD(P)-dependent alcohol dehydrogenase [Chloroflexota bacterium]|nr:MAG: NAD(P)-dependent alcohol dehydrogenase [Chloroflexota bacterium]
MKVALKDRYGPPEVVAVGEVERPIPEANRVLVRVRAASVNRADLDGLLPRPSFVRLFIGLRRPRNRGVGLDVAGIVEAVGPEATRFKVGDPVFGDLSLFHDGAFAEYVCVSEAAFQPIPAGMSFEVAATLPHSAILAVQGLRRRDGRTIGPGDRVLVDGASGNVGPFAVQIAKARGAEVTGVCSPAKVDFVRSLGADHVLDYTTVDYTRTGKRYDWIIDTDSHHSLIAVRRALAPGGTYVTLGGTASPILAALLLGPLLSRFGNRRLGLLTWWAPFRAEDVATVLELVGTGTVRPVIDRRYPLAEVVGALRWVNDGHARGKVIIEP